MCVCVCVCVCVYWGGGLNNHCSRGREGGGGGVQIIHFFKTSRLWGEGGCRTLLTVFIKMS